MDQLRERLPLNACTYINDFQSMGWTDKAIIDFFNYWPSNFWNENIMAYHDLPIHYMEGHIFHRFFSGPYYDSDTLTITPILQEMTFRDLIIALEFQPKVADVISERYPMAIPETYLPYLIWYLENEPPLELRISKDDPVCVWFRYGRGGHESAWSYLSPMSLMYDVLYASDDWSQVEPEFRSLLISHPRFRHYEGVIDEYGGGWRINQVRSYELEPLHALRKLYELEMMEN